MTPIDSPCLVPGWLLEITKVGHAPEELLPEHTRLAAEAEVVHDPGLPIGSHRNLRPGVDTGDGVTVTDRAAFVRHGRVNLLYTFPMARQALGLWLVVGAVARLAEVSARAPGRRAMTRRATESEFRVSAVREVPGGCVDYTSGRPRRALVARLAGDGPAVMAIGADRR